MECKNLKEDKLRKICRKYLETYEMKHLDFYKDKILNKFGIPLTPDRDDSIKKLSNYYKDNLDYEVFNNYRKIIISNIDYINKKNNEFINELNMTKLEYDIILSITEEEFNLIINSFKEKKKPDDFIKDKFKLFNRFMNIYSCYKFDNENIDDLLNLLEVKKLGILKLETLDMFQILKEMDIDIFIKTVINDEKILDSLRKILKNKCIGRLPDEMTYYFGEEYDLEFPGGINNIGLFLTKFRNILERKRMVLKSQGYDIDLDKISLSFSEIITIISVLNSGCEEIKRLFGSSAYHDFLTDSEPNSAHGYSRGQREEKIVKIADYLYTLDKVTIPSNDIIIDNNDKKINFIVGNRTNASNICHGERTGACMRVGGVGEGLFLKCLTDKNWFHIRIEDPDTHEYISRVSGFRKGNTVFLNQLRYSSNLDKYSNVDLQEFIAIYAKTLIEETKDSKYPIENVFINDRYAMSDYKLENCQHYYFGKRIQKEYNLDGLEDLRLRGNDNIWIDVRNDAILLVTTEEGSKTDEGYVPFNGGVDDTKIYDAVRDKIYGINYDEVSLKHQFVNVNNEVLMEKVNRVHAMKEKLLGKDYKYEIEDVLYYPEEIVDGYASSDFYAYIDSSNEIHSEYIEYIRKDNELIPYGQSEKAKEEIDRYIEILKNKYMEVRKVI